MYGWLLESVQLFLVQECGEEIWETILQEAGARNTVFSATQQYPDALMLRLASALVRFLTKDPNSPCSSQPTSPAPRKASIKSKQTWRTTSLKTDTRSPNSDKCLFTATNKLTAVTMKEMEAYNSSEEIAAQAATHMMSSEKINEAAEFEISNNKEHNRRSLYGKLEHHRTIDSSESFLQSPAFACPMSSMGLVNVEKKSKESEPTSSASEAHKSPTFNKCKARKTSVTLAVDVYKRRGSGAPLRPRLNSLSHTAIGNDKINALKEKFGTMDKVMHFFGRCFVKFFSNYGYDTMIRATGRYFCTFLQSVDSIHQRMRFTFPRMRSPSMQLTRAHHNGAELVYSSTRAGYAHYLMGQLYEIAEDIFSLELKVQIVKESTEGNYNVVVLRLEFDNSDYVQSLMIRKNVSCNLPPVPVSLLLQLFPFGVLLDRKMKIISAGAKLVDAWGGPYTRIEKQHVSEILRLRKPKISLTWDKVVCMQTMMFELELMRWCQKMPGDTRRPSQGTKAVLFKGPIYLLEEIDALIFLCSPIFNDLDELRQANLYLADMNGHGMSKEMLLHGWQHLSRLELLFEKAESRSSSLEKSCRLRDQWKNKGDQLLYSMIPRSVAQQLRAGKDPMSTCLAYDSVTVMFCGLQLAEAGTRADVMQTVAYMNDVYSKIDRMLDGHKVYKVNEYNVVRKPRRARAGDAAGDGDGSTRVEAEEKGTQSCHNVETVGTVYMLVAGVPDRRRAHAASAASAALAISRALPMLTIGVHSGSCMAGVLGLKLPRYCLVGDTVNTASRMQTSSEPGRIQISAKTAAELPAGRFRLRRRGLIKIKGKGMMETFWLEGELEEDDQDEALQLFSALCGDD